MQLEGYSAVRRHRSGGYERRRTPRRQYYIEYLEDTQVGCRVSLERAGVNEGRDKEETPGSEGEGALP